MRISTHRAMLSGLAVLTHKPRPERAVAVWLANQVLDEPGADPDSDVCILARQFNKERERFENMRASYRSVLGAFFVLAAVTAGAMIARWFGFAC